LQVDCAGRHARRVGQGRDTSLQFCCVGEEKASSEGRGAGSAAVGAEDDISTGDFRRFRRRSGGFDKYGDKES
jgi:hypothetical protein